MKQPVAVLKKILLGAVLIALSACLTVIIKESLDTKDPESALPLLTVTCNSVPITDVYRAGYEWSFFATVERRTPQLSEEDLPLVPVDVKPAAEIRLNFSNPPSSLQVQRAQGLASGDYLQIVSDDPSVFPAPNSPGIYVYKVIAAWQGRGYIQYYFALQVRDPQAASSLAPEAATGSSGGAVSVPGSFSNSGTGFSAASPSASAGISGGFSDAPAPVAGSGPGFSNRPGSASPGASGSYTTG